MASGADPDVVADLELAHFTVLNRSRKPAVLYQQTAEDPQRFVRLVELARSRDASRPVQTEAWFALFQCRIVPANREWVNAALRLLSDTEHLKAGEIYIGQMLSGSPMGDDGAWPSEFVRDVLDDLMSDDIAEGFVMGTLNDRGVSVRGFYEGGDQERGLSAKYEAWAQRVRDRWPYTARVLEACAQGFAQQADHWDRGAEDDHDA